MEQKKISVGGHINTYINFAMQQNYVPIIRNIVITNETEMAINNLTVKVNFEPAFAKEFTYNIECIEAYKTVEISPVPISLSTEFLFSLTEKMIGNIFIDVYEGEEMYTPCTVPKEMASASTPVSAAKRAASSGTV